jgi:Tol biopolymer transport system component
MVAATTLALLVSSAAVAPPAGAAVAPGSTLRASVQDGQSNADSPHGGDTPVITADGNSIVFNSNKKLDPSLDVGAGSSQPYYQIFVRDLVRNRTVMISRGIHEPAVIGLAGDRLLDLNGARLAAQQDTEHEEPPNGDSFDPTISADGRFVAFVTYASNIWGSVTRSHPGVIVCDRDPNGNGVFDENRTNSDNNVIRDYNCFRVDDPPPSNQDGFGWVSKPKLSADASRIVWHDHRFVSDCDECSFHDVDTIKTEPLPLVPGQNQGRRQRSQVQEVSPKVGTFNRVTALFDPAISGDGNHIVMRADVEENPNVCDCTHRWHEILSYNPGNGDTVRVDLDAGGKAVSTNLGEMVKRPAVNGNGTVIAFEGELFSDSGNTSRFDQPNVYVVNVDYAARNPVTHSEIASRNNKGDLVNGQLPALSADGRYLAFTTDALLTHDGVDQPASGADAFNCIHQPRGDLAHRPMLSFAASLPGQREGATRTFCQVVVRDLIVDQARLLAESARLPGTLASPGRSTNCTNALPPGGSCAGRGNSDFPSLSADGSRIGYHSNAGDLVAGDDENTFDVFVRTLEPTLTAGALDFGPVQLGTSITRTVTVQEVGNGPLVVETTTLGGTNAADFTVLGNTCVNGPPLHQTGTCLVTVEFTPQATGDRTGQLSLRARGNRTPFTVRLVGSGTEKPVPRQAEFKAEPSPVEFGQRLLLSPSPNSTVTVTNNGETPLQVTNVSVVGSAAGDFAIVGNTCGGNAVQPNGSCNVSVRYTPQAPGDRAATLQFNDNAAGGPHLVGLHGIAGAPTLEFSPGVTQPGRVVTAIGKGFPPNKKVFVTFPNAVDNSTATTDANGNFSVALVIFKKSKPETRSAVATVDGFPTITANAPLLIVFPTVSPADFVVRG